MKRYGPDSLNSWVIALACSFINMMMYGMARLSGVLFVASVPRFNVGREKASFPYTFCDFVRNSSGPLVGYLGYKFGVRTVTAFGAVIGALGAGLCYFAESIDMVTFLWGVIFGLGFGLGNILLPVSINQYFDKNRAIASGISFSGACLGSFALPPIVEILINKYGLSSTYLFLAGFILNCLPAALLLRKPNFEIQQRKPLDQEESERQSIVSGMKVKSYTAENYPHKPYIVGNSDSAVSIAPQADANLYQNYTALTYEERMKRLSTQTLLSDYSIRMSTSEPVDVDHIIENSKGRRQVDPKVLQGETFSLSSGNTEPDCFPENDDVFQRDNRSSSVQHEKQILPPNLPRTLSAEQLFHVNETDSVKRTKDEAYENHAYEHDLDNTNKKPDFISKTNFSRNSEPKYLVNREEDINNSYQNYYDDFKYPPQPLKKTFQKLADYQKNLESSEADSSAMERETYCKKEFAKTDKSSSLGSFSVIIDPMFILIAVTNAIYCFTFVCMVTILVDFARDLNVGESNEKYVIMSMSVGDLAGRLCLGWVTDRGYMSTPAFSALCFAFQGLFIAAIVWSDGLITLVALSTMYGLSESGIIVIFPVIMAQYIEPEKQTVAIPSSNFLSGPLCLAVAPLIGYFRDDVGAYDWIFYGLAILSAVCCLSWMFAPCIAKCQKHNNTKSR